MDHLLFILYYLYKLSDKIYIVLFADDTNVLIDGNNFNQLVQKLNSELQKFYPTQINSH